MRRTAAAAIALLVACGKKDAPREGSGSAPPVETPVATIDAAPAPAPPDAAAAPPPVTIEPAAWPRQVGAELRAAIAPGPFESVDAICAAMHEAPCDQVELDGAIDPPFTGAVRIVAALPDPDGSRTETMSDVSVALQTRAGWFVLPRLGQSANDGRLDAAISMVGVRGTIHYGSAVATLGRWAKDYEEGVIACGVDQAGAVACTAKIPTAVYSTEASEAHGDRVPEGKVTTTFACDDALIAGDHLVIGDRRPDKDKGKDAQFPPPIRGACAKLAYAGDHAVSFPP